MEKLIAIRPPRCQQAGARSRCRAIRPTRIAAKEAGIIKNFLPLLVGGGGRLKG